MPVVRTDGLSGGRAVYGHVIAKFSQIGRLLHFLTHGAPLARFARESSAIIFLYEVTQGVNHADKWRSCEVLNEGVSTFSDFTEKLGAKNGKRGHGKSLATRVNSLFYKSRCLQCS